MKRYLWVVELAMYRCGPWFLRGIYESRSEARAAEYNPIYGYHRVVKFERSTAAGTKRGVSGR